MTTETRPSDYDRQAEHAALFGAVAQRMLQAAGEFAESVGPVLTVTDCGRIYWAAGCKLALAGNSPATVADWLRELADRIEAGAPVAN